MFCDLFIYTSVSFPPPLSTVYYPPPHHPPKTQYNPVFYLIVNLKLCHNIDNNCFPPYKRYLYFLVTKLTKNLTCSKILSLSIYLTVWINLSTCLYLSIYQHNQPFFFRA